MHQKSETQLFTSSYSLFSNDLGSSQKENVQVDLSIGLKLKGFNSVRYSAYKLFWFFSNFTVSYKTVKHWTYKVTCLI